MLFFLIFQFIFIQNNFFYSSFAEELKQASVDNNEPLSVEEFLQRLSSVRRVLSRRDPFEEALPSYVKSDRPTINIEEATAEISAEDLPPLQRFPSESYVVQAVLLGDRFPRALVKIPNGGTAVVMEKAQLGDKNGIIKKIDRTGVQLLERIKNTFGSFDNVSVLLPVGGIKGGRE